MGTIHDTKLYQELEKDGWVVDDKLKSKSIYENAQYLWWYKYTNTEKYDIKVKIGTQFSQDSQYVFAIVIYLDDKSGNLDKEFEFSPSVSRIIDITSLNKVVANLIDGVISISTSYLDLLMEIEEEHDEQEH